MIMMSPNHWRKSLGSLSIIMSSLSAIPSSSETGKVMRRLKENGLSSEEYLRM